MGLVSTVGLACARLGEAPACLDLPVRQRSINPSMSDCMRSLRSLDHAAPGFWLSLLWGRGGEALTARGDLRAAIFSLRMGRRNDVLAGLDGCIEG